MPRLLPFVLLLVGVFMLGAACAIKTNVTSGNTNVTISTNVNTSIINSAGSGSFSTNTGN